MPLRYCEVEIHEDELTVGRNLFYDQLQFARCGLSGPRQVFDERALTVHMDVHGPSLRMEPVSVMEVFLPYGLCAIHELELVFTQTRERQGNHDGHGGGAQNGNVFRLLCLVHTDLLQGAPLSGIALRYLYYSINSMYMSIAKRALFQGLF